MERGAGESRMEWNGMEWNEARSAEPSGAERISQHSENRNDEYRSVRG